jgi:parallel beta-helix repeat protein
MKTNISYSLLILALLLGSTVPAFNQGSLLPPGAPAPTMRTLDQIEPRTPINATTTPGDADSIFRITQPGSYFFTGNITGVAGKHGIEVAASNVTIDMRGFELAGVPGSLAGFDLNNDAIGGLTGIVIFNGNIRNWGNEGILGNQSGADHFHHLHISFVGGLGISINTGTIIDHCRVTGCSQGGIGTSNNVIITDTVADGNTGSGISAGTDSQIRGCDCETNSGHGISTFSGIVENCATTANGGAGISAGNSGNVHNSRADGNGQGGIVVGTGGVVRACTANSNTGIGISAGSTSNVTDCAASSNTTNGIQISAGNVTKCTARSNTGDGISASSGSVVDSCTVANNGDDGITTGSGCAVNNCAASANGGDGISIVGDCRVINNNCDGNGTAGTGGGIHLPNALIGTNADTRIEGNNCTDNDHGIWVEDSGNLIIRNSASGNTTAAFTIAAGNNFGTIVVLAGGGAFSSTNAWGNIEF